MPGKKKNKEYEEEYDFDFEEEEYEDDDEYYEDEEYEEERRRKKKHSAGDIILAIVLFVAFCIFAYAAYNLYHIYTEYKKGSDEYNAIAEMAVTEREPDKKKTKKKQGEITPALVAPMSIDFASLRAVNDDVIGWIYMEAIEDINYPMVRGIDNNYYLHQTYQRNYNFAGTIFVDMANSDDFNDCNTIIYGHNMKNGSMFGQLKDYSESLEPYNTSKYFWIFTPEYDYRYEIISAYTTQVNSVTYTLFKGPGQEFLDYMNTIVGLSDIPTTPGALSVNDKVVTLSTCTNDESTRYVVQGKRVDTIRKTGTGS